MKIIIWIGNILILLGVLLGAGHVLAKKSAHSEIIINATPEQVWAVLTDMATYPEWNPTMKLVSGKIAESEKVSYEFTDSTGAKSTISAKVKQVIPNKLLNQAGGVPTIITYDHRYTLTPIDDGRKTKVTIHEDYRGVYVWFWDPATVEQAYMKLNNALKLRVENFFQQ